MSAPTYTVDVQYGIKYTTTKPVPIPEIVNSLEALARIIKRTPKFVEKSFEGIQVVETDVYISKIESGSLIENFIVRYVFKDKENYDTAKQVFDKIMADNTAIRTIVAMSVGGLIVYGVMNALPSNQPTTNLQMYNSTIMNIGADMNFEAGEIRAMLEATSDKKSLARDAVSAVRPAKADSNATIEVIDMPSIEMPSAAIAEAPEEYEPPIPEEREVSYTNTQVVIYASDRDKSESGWAGIVPGVVDRRINMILDSNVDPMTLHGRTQVRADITVLERYVASKNRYEPRKVEIIRVN